MLPKNTHNHFCIKSLLSVPHILAKKKLNIHMKSINILYI